MLIVQVSPLDDTFFQRFLMNT